MAVKRNQKLQGNMYALDIYGNYTPHTKRKLRGLAAVVSILASACVVGALAIFFLRTDALSREVWDEYSAAAAATEAEMPLQSAQADAYFGEEPRTSSRSLRVKEEMPYGALPGAGAEDEADAQDVSRVVSFAKSSIGRKPPGGYKVELLDWFTKGGRAFPRGAEATVVDVETGLSFRVRRFGGWYHADSYPLTKADTAVMKRMYGGEWSWDRRAIWVIVGKRAIAASMNGMPHMADANRKDDFPGHFCIHFYKSKVHRTEQECPVHQAMVKRAFIAAKTEQKSIKR